MGFEMSARRAAPFLILMAACSESAGTDAGGGAGGMAGGSSDDDAVVSSPWTVEGGTFLDAPSSSHLFAVIPDEQDGWVVQIAALTSVGDGNAEVRTLRDGVWRTVGRKKSAGDLVLMDGSIYHVELSLDGTRFSLGQFQEEPEALLPLGMSSPGAPITRVVPFVLRGELYVVVHYSGAHAAIQHWDGEEFLDVTDTLEAGITFPFARSLVSTDDDSALIELRLAGDAAAPAMALRFDGAELTVLDTASASDQRWELPRYCRIGGVDYVLHDAGEHSVLERLEAAGKRVPLMQSADGVWWLGRTCSRTHLMFTEYANNKPALAPRGLRAFDGTRLVSLPTEHDSGLYAAPVLSTLYPPPAVAFAGEHAGAFHYWLDVIAGVGRVDKFRSYHLTRPTL